MTFEKGSLILVDYTARIKDGDVFDTTIEEDAKEHSIHDEDAIYRPKLISIGEIAYSALQGLDDGLAKTAVGDKITIEIPPEKGFGERDSGKVRMIPIRKLGDDADKVSVGDEVEIDNRHGVIRFIGSGRVQIDYNHRFAGKTILYDVNVIKSLDTPADKIGAMLQSRLSVEDPVEFDLRDNKLDVTVPKELMSVDRLHITKQVIQMDIFKFVPTLEQVNFVEVYLNENVKKEDQTQVDENTAQSPDQTTQATEPDPEPQTA